MTRKRRWVAISSVVVLAVALVVSLVIVGLVRQNDEDVTVRVWVDEQAVEDAWLAPDPRVALGKLTSSLARVIKGSREIYVDDGISIIGADVQARHLPDDAVELRTRLLLRDEEGEFESGWTEYHKWLSEGESEMLPDTYGVETQ